MIGFARATIQTLQVRCRTQLGFGDEDVKAIRTIHSRCWEEVSKGEKKYWHLTPQNMKIFKNQINTPYKDWVKIKDFERQSKGRRYR